jgi:hypothetical protein
LPTKKKSSKPAKKRRGPFPEDSIFLKPAQDRLKKRESEARARAKKRKEVDARISKRKKQAGKKK